mmetsp:Transcript_86879/g.246377  ORF Transcript_86879/g.246377 Transcript_86879/m.246377 type:complete len:222 (-) Transcript_86879:484-1149(-)
MPSAGRPSQAQRYPEARAGHGACHAAAAREEAAPGRRRPRLLDAGRVARRMGGPLGRRAAGGEGARRRPRPARRPPDGVVDRPVAGGPAAPGACSPCRRHAARERHRRRARGPLGQARRRGVRAGRRDGLQARAGGAPGGGVHRRGHGPLRRHPALEDPGHDRLPGQPQHPVHGYPAAVEGRGVGGPPGLGPGPGHEADPDGVGPAPRRAHLVARDGGPCR